MLLFLVAAAAAVLAPGLASAATWNDPTTPYYVTEPSCGSYKCHVKWAAGQKVAVNWYNGGKGYSQVVLESTGSGKSYTIARKVKSTMNYQQCDGGHGVGRKGRPCGRVEFKVPAQWAAGEYSVAVHSLSGGGVGYTDIVDVVKGRKSGGKARRQLGARAEAAAELDVETVAEVDVELGI